MDEKLKEKIADWVRDSYPGWEIEVVDSEKRYDFYTVRPRHFWLIPLRPERLRIFSIIEDSGKFRVVPTAGNMRTAEDVRKLLAEKSIGNTEKRS